MNRRKGFTLIELMIIVAILGIMVSIALPQYLSYIAASKETVLSNNFDTAVGLVRNEIAKKNAGETVYLDTPDEFVAALNNGNKKSVYDVTADAFATGGNTPGTVVITKNAAAKAYTVMAYDRHGNPLSGRNITIVEE